MPSRASPGSHSDKDLRHAYREGSPDGELQVDLTHNTLWVDDVTFGENVKGWRENLRRGLPATTSMNGNRLEIRYTPGLGSWSIPKNGNPTHIWKVTVRGCHTLFSDVPGGSPSSISSTGSDSLALGKFNRRVREQLTAFQGGVFLGELGQTLRMIRNPAQGLRRLADDWRSIAIGIRRLGRTGAAARSRVAGNLADAWLEVQFGWKPLLHDIDDGCKALAQYNSVQSLSTGRITAQHTVDRVLTASNVLKTQNGFARWRCYLEEIESSQTIYRGALRVDARNRALMPANLMGFTPDNWLPTAWELIPYSFLIDYFVNIGDIIEGWSQLYTNLAWCNRTRRKSITVTSHSKDESFSGTTASFSAAKIVVRKSNVTRAEVQGDRIPDLDFRVPGFGSLRWLNIAALIAGRNNDRKWSYD